MDRSGRRAATEGAGAGLPEPAVGDEPVEVRTGTRRAAGAGPDGARPTRVLVVDDHELARLGLVAMLGTAPWIVVAGSVDGCEPALAAIAAAAPDIVLLDIGMPTVDGLTCLERIRATSPRVAVVMMTFFDDRSHIVEAIRRGASGYLLKDAAADQVIETLARVADGRLAIDGDLLRAALSEPARFRAVPGTGRTGLGSGLSPLSSREHEVLRGVAEGMTNKEIGAALGIAEDTVKKHVQNVIWKLQSADRTQAAITAYRMGLLGGEDG